MAEGLTLTKRPGLFADAANSSLTISDSQGGTNGIASRRTRPAFVGDVNVNAIYQFNDRWALRVGYQLLWLSGVAVAPAQFNNVDFNSGRLTTNTSHGAFFHGALVGLERSW